jgi:hypothetical protein
MKKHTTKKVTIELTYNGFHGRNSFTLRVPPPQELTSGVYQNSDTYILDLSPSQIARINRVVGCQTHKTVFGNRHKIEGACGCGEGLPTADDKELIYATLDGHNAYYIKGRYPQN